MEKKNILVISYYYLPSICSNAKRPYYISKQLAAEGHRVEVVTSYRLLPNNFRELVSNNNIYIKRISDPMEYFRVKTRIKILKFTYRIGKKVLWPDTFVMWIIRVFFCYSKRIHEFDVILVQSTPISSVLLCLNREIVKKAILDFQDIYTNTAPVRGYQPLYKILMPLINKIQNYVLKYSSANIFAAESYIKEYKKAGMLSERDRTHCIPFFYENINRDECNINSQERFNICYMGQFGKGKNTRSPKFFFKSLNSIIERNEEFKKDVVFEFYGSWIDDNYKYIDQYKLRESVLINKPVSYTKYIEIIGQAAVLLLVTSNADNIFVPSKLMDYMAARRPIFGYVPCKSETYRILKNTNMHEYVVEESDSIRGADILQMLWLKWKKGELIVDNARSELYSANYQIPRYIDIIYQTVKSQTSKCDK